MRLRPRPRGPSRKGQAARKHRDSLCETILAKSTGPVGLAPPHPEPSSRPNHFPRAIHISGSRSKQLQARSHITQRRHTLVSPLLALRVNILPPLSQLPQRTKMGPQA